MFPRSVTAVNLGAFPASAAKREGAATPVTDCIWPIRSTLLAAGVTPMASNTLSQNLYGLAVRSEERRVGKECGS